MLENHCERLIESDCQSAGYPELKHMGCIGRLMVARMQQVKGHQLKQGLDSNQTSPARDCPRVHYKDVCHQYNPFPGPSLLDPVDTAQEADVKAAA